MQIEEKFFEAADNASNAARMYLRSSHLEKAEKQIRRRIQMLRQTGECSEVTSDQVGFSS